MEARWFIGKIIENNDPDQLGRVKATLYDVDSLTEEKDNLVWCYPDQGIYNIPEIDELYWFKVVDKFLVKRFYTHKVHRKNYTDFNIFDKEIKPTINGFSGTYPSNKGFLTKSKNGFYFNSETGESLFIGKSAYMFINSNNKFIIKNNSESLKQLISDLINIIKNIKTIGSPANHTVSPESQILLEELLLRISTLLEN